MPSPLGVVSRTFRFEIPPPNKPGSADSKNLRENLKAVLIGLLICSLLLLQISSRIARGRDPLLKITGRFTFPCVQEWPPPEVCPNGKKFRAVDRSACEHYEASFSLPEKNGTEIFELLKSLRATFTPLR